MKIALVVPGFPEGAQAWAIPALLDLVEGLAAHHEVVVVTLRYPHRAGRYLHGGARVHALGGATQAGWRRFPLLARAAGRLLTESRTRPFDLVHGLWADEPGFVAVAAGRMLRRPALVSVLGGELERIEEIQYGGARSAANRWLAARALAGAAAVTVGSELLATRWKARVGRARLRRVPLGVDTSLFFPADAPPLSPPGRLHLVQVASLTPVKAHGSALRAVAAAEERPRLHLHLVGEGPRDAALRQQAVDLGIEGQVTFHGAVAHERLPALYRAADLCLLTSRYESQSMVALEAAACGRATIGSRVGLLPELVAPAWLVPPGDVAGLADRLDRIVRAPAQLDAMGSEARRRVEAGYRLDQSLEQWQEIYRELTRAGAPPPAAPRM